MPSSHFNISGNDYLTLLISTCVRLMEFGINDENVNVEDKTIHSTIRANSVQFLQLILKYGNDIEEINQFVIPLSELSK